MTHPEIKTYLIKEYDLVISVCSQLDIMSGFFDHYVSGKIEAIPQNSFDDLKNLVSFAGVLTPFMPSDGILAFTASFPLKKRKVFCLFDNREKKYVARSHFWNAEESDKKQRLAFQKVSVSKEDNSVSMIDCLNKCCDSDNIEDLFQRYLDVEEKHPCRFFVKDSNFVLIKALSEISKDIFSGLFVEIERNFNTFANSDNLLQEYFFSFNCGCNSTKINAIFSTFSQIDLDYIFEKDDEVTTECPRCGLTYKMRKNEIIKN